jgi:hypothetical protein
MYPEENRAIYRQQLRRHVDDSTPKVAKRTDWVMVLVWVIGILATVGLIHQLWERQ